MNKSKYIIICILALILSSILASAELEITDIKAYVNDSRRTGIDEDGGSFTAYPGARVELRIYLENTWDTKIEKIDMIGTIEDIAGDDLVDDEPSFDLSGGSTTTKTLEWRIPDNAKKDEYIINLLIEGEVNGSSMDDIEMDFTLEIDVPEVIVEEEIQKTYDMLIDSNLEMQRMINKSFDYADRWGMCEKDKGEKEVYTKVYEDTRSDFHGCLNNMTGVQTELSTCKVDKEGMLTEGQCQTDINNATKKTKDDMMSYVYIGGAGIFLWWQFVYKKRKEIKGGGEGAPLHRI